MKVLSKNKVKLKNQSTGEFESMDFMAGETTKSFTDKITALGNSTISQIQNKGTETLDSIPEDYTELNNRVEELENGAVETIKYIETDKTDVDEMLDIGFYTKGSNMTWTNLPDDVVGSAACVLIVAGLPGLNNRTCQMLITHENQLYIRYYVYKNSKMGEWKKVMVENDKFELDYICGHHALSSEGTVNLDDIISTGYYFYGSSNTLENAPSIAGVLLVLKGKYDYSIYQMWFDYYGNLYTRNFIYGKGFTEWKQISYNDGNNNNKSVNGMRYNITKVDNTTLYIYKNGVKGYVRYTYKRHVNENINLDIWRLYEIQLCDTNKNVLKTLSQSGADLEGVVLLNGEADHVGGIHGDEQTTNYFLFVNGTQYTFDNVPDMECNEVKVVVTSTITHADTTNICMNKVKQTTFDKDGVHINCEWEALEVLDISSIRSCMFSIKKECFTHYYDSNVNRVPIERTEVSSTTTEISNDSNITDIFYVGDVSARHWSGRRGGDTSKLSTLIVDYGGRIKSYFNCYDGHTTTVGEKMFAENHFNIEY